MPKSLVRAKLSPAVDNTYYNTGILAGTVDEDRKPPLSAPAISLCSQAPSEPGRLRENACLPNIRSGCIAPLCNDSGCLSRDGARTLFIALIRVSPRKCRVPPTQIPECGITSGHGRTIGSQPEGCAQCLDRIGV